VTKPAPGEARKLTAWAMSSGVPILPTGTEDVGMALDGDEPGRDRVHGDAERREFTGPAAGESDLRVLGRGVGGPSDRGPVGDFGIDLNDPAVAPNPHRGDDFAPQEHRAFHEEVELIQMLLPAHLTERGLGLWAGRVQHQHLDRAELAGDRGHQPGDLALVGHVEAEGSGDPALAPNDVHDLLNLSVVLRAGQPVDRDRVPVLGKSSGDGAAQSPRTAGHECNQPRTVADRLITFTHHVILPLRTPGQAPGAAEFSRSGRRRKDHGVSAGSCGPLWRSTSLG